MCLLKIAEPVCERIFEQTKHQIVIVLASEFTVHVLSYLNVSSVIPTPFFTQQMDFGKTVNHYL